MARVSENDAPERGVPVPEKACAWPYAGGRLSGRSSFGAARRTGVISCVLEGGGVAVNLLPLVGHGHGGGVGVAADADVALDGEDGVGVAELVGDDGGVEAEVEEHPAGGDVAQVIG